MKIIKDTITFNGVRGYIDENNVAQFNLEDISKGLGFTQYRKGVQYIRWNRVRLLLCQCGFELPLDYKSNHQYIPYKIFHKLAMKANSKKANEFKNAIADWVTFANKPMSTTFEESISMIQRQYDELRKKNEELQLIVQEQELLNDYVDSRIKGCDNINMKDLLEIVNRQVSPIGQNKLYQKLREWKLIMPDKTEPYQTAVDRGYFVVEEVPIKTPYGNRISFTTKVTPKGQVSIVERYRKEVETNNE